MKFFAEPTESGTLQRAEEDPAVVATHERLLVAARQAQEARDQFDAVKTTSGPTNYKYEKFKAERDDAAEARKIADREYDAALDAARDRIAGARKAGHRELVEQFEEVLGRLEQVLAAIAAYDQETYDRCHRRHGIPAQYWLGHESTLGNGMVKESMFDFVRRLNRQERLLD